MGMRWYRKIQRILIHGPCDQRWDPQQDPACKVPPSVQELSWVNKTTNFRKWWSWFLIGSQDWYISLYAFTLQIRTCTRSRWQGESNQRILCGLKYLSHDVPDESNVLQADHYWAYRCYVSESDSCALPTNFCFYAQPQNLYVKEKMCVTVTVSEKHSTSSPKSVHQILKPRVIEAQMHVIRHSGMPSGAMKIWLQLRDGSWRGMGMSPDHLAWQRHWCECEGSKKNRKTKEVMQRQCQQRVDFLESQRAVEDRLRLRQLVLRSSVLTLPVWPSGSKDRQVDTD